MRVKARRPGARLAFVFQGTRTADSARASNVDITHIPVGATAVGEPAIQAFECDWLTRRLAFADARPRLRVAECPVSREQLTLSRHVLHISYWWSDTSPH